MRVHFAGVREALYMIQAILCYTLMVLSMSTDNRKLLRAMVRDKKEKDIQSSLLVCVHVAFPDHSGLHLLLPRQVQLFPPYLSLLLICPWCPTPCFLLFLPINPIFDTITSTLQSRSQPILLNICYLIILLIL